MGTFFSDTFTGTNGTTLQSHVPDVGGGWTKFSSTTSGDDFTISSNAIVGTATLTNVANYVGNTGAGTPNVSVQVDIKRVNANNTTMPGSVFLRYVSANTYYRIDVTQTTVSLVRVDGGVTTTLASAGSSSNLNINHTLRVEVSGAAPLFTVYSDNATLFSYTDSATISSGLQTSDKVGLGGNGYTQFDNFSAQTFVPQDWSSAILKDTFDGAANTKLDAHTPNTGIQWGSLDATTTAYIKLNGTGAAVGQATANASYLNLVQKAGDFVYQVDLTRTTFTGSGTSKIIFRFLDDGSRYELWIDQTIQLKRISSTGAGTNLGTATSADTNQVMTFRIEAVGKTITIYKNNALLSTITDNASGWSTAGWLGIGTSQYGTFDNLYARTMAQIAAGTGSSSGVSTADAGGVGIVTRSADGVSTGLATATAQGVTFHTGFGSSTAGATADGVGLTLQFHTGAGSAAGLASSDVKAVAIATGTGVSIAESDAVAESNSLAPGEGIGRSAGSVYAQADGSAVMTGTAVAAGSTTSAFRGSSIMEGVIAAAAGVATVLGSSKEPTPQEPVIVSAVGSAAGTSTVTALNVLPVVARFTIEAGATLVRGAGQSIRSGIASASGSTAANADGTGIRESIGAFARRSLAAFVALITPTDTVVPPERTLTPVVESRTITPAHEDRFVILPADLPRKLVLTAEVRTVVVSAGLSRTIILPAEERTITL